MYSHPNNFDIKYLDFLLDVGLGFGEHFLRMSRAKLVLPE